MSTHKHFDKICYAVLAVTLIITVLFMNGEKLGITPIVSEDSSSDMFTANDLNSDWDTSNAENIILSDDGSIVKGSYCYVYNGDIYITNSGYYIISGELSDGSIIIDAESNDKIWLMLNGVSINCNDDAAIRVEQADKVFLTLANGTENNISSGSEYRSDVVSSGVDGVIYSRDDLTINGNGNLNVTAKYKHGIVANDDLVITGGNITIDAVKDAIHANDSVRITNADINISAGDDGITVSNDDETAYMYIESGKINIESCYEGLEAINITIAGGTINIYPTDDGINANGSGKNSVINITGGNITIINNNGRDADGLDSNKDIYISGGNVFISVSDDGSSSAIDYGSENNGTCEISGGTVLACGSSGMAEGFASSSPQGFIMYTTSASAGTTVTVEDSYGNKLISNEIPCAFSSIVVSTPEMSVGDVCTITVGETQEEITVDNANASAGFGQGTGFGNGKNDNFSPEDKSANSDNFTNQIEPPSDTQNPQNGQSFDYGQNGNPPDMPSDSGNNIQPQMPNNIGGGEQPDVNNFTDGQEGNPPEIPDGADKDNNPTDLPQQSGDIGDKSNDFNFDNADFNEDGKQQNSDNNFFQPDREDEKINNGNSAQSQGENSNYALTNTDIIYIFVSIGVLILGCVIAFIFKRRK